jgi:HEAT repeats
MLRTSLWRSFALPALLTAVVLLPLQSAGAWCNTPRPAIPGGGGGPITTPGRAGGVPTPRSGGGVGTGGARGPGSAGTFGTAGSWRIWWDMNREYLLGIQGMTRVQVSGDENESTVDPIGRERSLAQDVLRRVALSASHEDLRAAALVALGRAGSARDAAIFLRILRTPHQPREVVQASAIGLALLPVIENEEQREEIRRLFSALIGDRVKMPERTRLLAIMALSLRGRSDPALIRILALKLEERKVDANEASALLYGSGLLRSDLAAPLLSRAVGTGELGRRRLHDVARSHAVLALALAGGADAISTLKTLLGDRKTQVHTRRSAAIALGRILAGGKVSLDDRATLEKLLVKHMNLDPDPLVKGYSAIALGIARPPFEPDALLRCLSEGDGTTRPYAALALGLAARNLHPGAAVKVRKVLLGGYRKARGPEMPGALAIALGLAGAEEAGELLAVVVANEKVGVDKRAPACQALGLLKGENRNHLRALVIALNSSSDEVAQNAALGLGLRGGEGIAAELVRMLRTTRSEMMQLHMVTGLSHLGGPEVVEPLLAIVADPEAKRDRRISAATALGLIITRSERDPLFEIDAYSNPFGLTEASRELVRVF